MWCTKQVRVKAINSFDHLSSGREGSIITIQAKGRAVNGPALSFDHKPQ
jgi:hypothetical protein